ncbi:zinc-binding dehydrogenase [Peribacillus sp. NJ11]|uniref:zinc-binding dehydrogenase n=1 Tax=Peribacillus sp. NJ11 TaxID=3055861 RepID=UPI0025A17A34|nr:zinc-binding dehydrogenase [Peribacillus sp. NJ11]MDM5223534.1 zinc-binding dehydrogenase [Peribacillus sp. NJ11]
MIAVQLAKWEEAHVIGTCSTKNVNFLYSLGVDTVIDYTSESFEKIVQDVDLVVDTVGTDTLERSWSVVKKGGRLLKRVLPLARLLSKSYSNWIFTPPVLLLPPEP